MVELKKHSRKNLKIIHYPPKFPLSVHLYITNECNLNCEKCYYRSSEDPKRELSLIQIKKLFQEWKHYGITSLAIGGGEPILHPNIENIIEFGRKLGFFMAVTTNATILKRLKADRIHISYDKLHPTWGNETLIQNGINHYKKIGCKVGINHIVRKMGDIDYIKRVFHNIDNILLIREKPESKFNQWSKLQHSKLYWIEGCIKGSRCEQGVLSFHLDYNMCASICSNFKKKVHYTNLQETWNKLRDFKCSIRDYKGPRLF